MTFISRGFATMVVDMAFNRSVLHPGSKPAHPAVTAPAQHSPTS
jgi:hypothetical protein